jgi:N-acylneuraminate cytidylyltransferase
MRLLDGKPLLAHTIEAACSSARVSRCIVSTEDAEIAEAAALWQAEVVLRPDDLSRDDSRSETVVRHALAASGTPPAFVLLQPTSPLRTSAHIDASVDLFFSSQAASVVSVCRAMEHPFKMLRVADGKLVPFRDLADLSSPRQALPPVYRQNGAIYVARTESFLRQDAFVLAPSVPYEMNAEDSIDIDTEFDLEVAALLLSRRRFNG